MISTPFPEVHHGYESSLLASVSQKAQLLADLKGMEAVNFRERIQARFTTHDKTVPRSVFEGD